MIISVKVKLSLRHVGELGSGSIAPPFLTAPLDGGK
jgi:hypothetical protein